jgi:hypothetical protein
MSDIPVDYKDRLDLREQIARIDRAIEEGHKFTAEQHKLMTEEQKLASERRKLDRDRGLAPWQATAITVGSIAAFVASIVSLAKSMGWLG